MFSRRKKFTARDMYWLELQIRVNSFEYPTDWRNNTEYHVDEKSYIELAQAIPYDELVLDLKRYDANRLYELKFLNDLSEKYGKSSKDVLKRIHQVRKIQNYKNKNGIV